MKLRVFIPVALIAATLVSCASVKVPVRSSELNAALEPKDFDIRGEVVLEGATRSVLGLYTWGGATYYDLIQEAKEKYGADDVVNMSIDIRATAFFIFYVKQEYVMRGIAISYKK